MKNTGFILIIFIFIAIFSSCSTDVEMYADYKDVAVIYAMLDYRADTNFVKITRAFCGSNDNPIDANEIALIADSSNYPDKLDVRIFELKNIHGGPYEPTGRVIVLDTITLHNKEQGVFYAPDQTFYYTAEPFNTGTENIRYKYHLVVVKPNGDTVTAQTSMVGNDDFCILTSSVVFQLEHSDVLKKINFRADDMASLYNVKMQFNYSEQHAGMEKEWKNVSFSFGTKPIFEYNISSNNIYYVEYSNNWLFNALENAIGGDTVVDANHPNVIRHIGSFIVSISAGGDELTLYYSENQAQLNSPMSLISIYSNINGGFGIFSSRTTIKKTVDLSYSTKRDLFSVSAWGFKEQ